MISSLFENYLIDENWVDCLDFCLDLEEGHFLTSHAALFKTLLLFFNAIKVLFPFKYN